MSPEAASDGGRLCFIRIRAATRLGTGTYN
jgi:hypothetical protein